MTRWTREFDYSGALDFPEPSLTDDETPAERAAWHALQVEQEHLRNAHGGIERLLLARREGELTRGPLAVVTRR